MSRSVRIGGRAIVYTSYHDKYSDHVGWNCENCKMCIACYNCVCGHNTERKKLVNKQFYEKEIS